MQKPRLYFELFTTNSSGPPAPMTSFRVSWRHNISTRHAGGIAGGVNPVMIGSVGLSGSPLSGGPFMILAMSATGVADTVNCMAIVSVPPTVGLAPPGYGVRAEFFMMILLPSRNPAEVDNDLIALARTKNHVRRGNCSREIAAVCRDGDEGKSYVLSC